MISDSLKTSHRKRKNCPLCSAIGLEKLGNHLKDVHNLGRKDRKKMIQMAEDYSNNGKLTTI